MTDGRIHRHGRIYLFLSANGQRDNIPPSSLGKGPQRRPRSPFSDTSYSRLLPKLTFSASVGLRSLYACHHRPRRLQGYSEREGAAHSRRPYVFRPVEDAMTCELQELYDFPAWFSLLPWSQRDCPGYLPEHRQRRPSPTSPSSAQDAEISHVDQISAQNLWGALLSRRNTTDLLPLGNRFSRLLFLSLFYTIHRIYAFLYFQSRYVMLFCASCAKGPGHLRHPVTCVSAATSFACGRDANTTPATENSAPAYVCASCPGVYPPSRRPLTNTRTRWNATRPATARLPQCRFLLLP
ncbi:uncharacterized protein J3D65DRAFT_374633 [Phyllosticta citribraziliensis]|uniref:Uncharacterized protein n=1 Tax=Phyllosticta citribraziliensis TaxID=989973 RepID=A0ABR1LU29_9PEZI